MSSRCVIRKPVTETRLASIGRLGTSVVPMCYVCCGPTSRLNLNRRQCLKCNRTSGIIWDANSDQWAVTP